MEKERLYGKAKQDDQGAVALVLDLAQAFERVSLLVVWAWATHSRKILRCCAVISSTRGEYSSKGAWRSRFRPSAILPGSKWSCLVLWIVLQDAISEVTNIYPPLKLRVFVDDITALLKGKNRDIVEMAKKVMKKLKEEVEKKGLKLSVTENGKEGQSKMSAPRGFLENELRQFSGEEGVALADSVETLGVDLRTRAKRLGAKEKARRKKCKERFLHIKKIKKLHERGC